MSSFPSIGLTPGFPRISAVPVLRGRQYSAGELYSLGRLPTDSLGNYILTLTNVAGMVSATVAAAAVVFKIAAPEAAACI